MPAEESIQERMRSEEDGAIWGFKEVADYLHVVFNGAAHGQFRRISHLEDKGLLKNQRCALPVLRGGAG